MLSDNDFLYSMPHTQIQMKLIIITVTFVWIKDDWNKVDIASNIEGMHIVSSAVSILMNLFFEFVFSQLFETHNFFIDQISDSRSLL